MKQWKSLLALLLCVVMVGALAACGGGAGSSAAPAESTPSAEGADATGDEGASEAAGAAGGSIEFWNDKMAELDNAIIEELQTAIEDSSGIKTTIVGYPDVASYQTAIQQSIGEATGPGMFTWWNGPQLETLAQNGLLVDLTQEWEDYYIPAGVAESVADSLTVDGKIMAAPYGILNNAVFYNKKVFADNGVEVPTTFAEFQDACAALLAAGVTPIGLKDDSWASFIWFQQFLAAYDPALYEGVCDGSLPYTDAKVVEVMEMWRGMIDAGNFTQPMKYNDMWKAFAGGEIAMMLEPANSLPRLVDEYGLVPEEDYSLFALPSVDSEQDVVFFEVSPMAIPAATADVEAAKTALRGFMDAPAQTIMANKLGMAGSSTVPIEDPTLAKMIGLGSEPDKYTLILRFYENTPAELRDVAIDELARFMYSGADVSEVLETIQTKADETFGGSAGGSEAPAESTSEAESAAE